MSASQKILAASALIVILLSLGTVDYLLTNGTMRIPTDGGIAKMKGSDIVAIAIARGFIPVNTTEDFLLAKILPAGTTLSSRVLLMKDDRVAALAWIESPEVKTIFTTLKQRLRPSFSPKLQDLIDETQSEPGKPPRDILSFRDPAIHSDRLVFARVRDRLFEFHVTDGKEDAVDGLLDALTE